jgi:hypothetical protein
MAESSYANIANVIGRLEIVAYDAFQTVHLSQRGDAASSEATLSGILTRSRNPRHHWWRRSLTEVGLAVLFRGAFRHGYVTCLTRCIFAARTIDLELRTLACLRHSGAIE